MNTPVNFEIAQLLKEKGFDENCFDYYTSTGGLNSDGWGDVLYEQGFGSGEPDRMFRFNYSDFNKHQKETCYLCPTIAEVVMWLYEKHGIWVSVHKATEVKWTNSYFNYGILSPKGTVYSDIGGTKPNTPTEAYKAAIKYCLTKLI